MASFTDQIREIIKESTVSSYAIAKQTGISETLLGRFLKGERGLSLNSVDKLAEMFGIVAITGSQILPRPTKRGRKPKKKEETMSVTATSALHFKPTWSRVTLCKLAKAAAKVAYEDNFQSRLGVYEYSDLGTPSERVFCIYNNNPFELNDGICERRAAETLKLRNALKKAGIKELAYETYPFEGEESAGYTYAMLVSAKEKGADFIANTMNEIIQEGYANRSAK